jgi:hypothetical protein
LVVHLEIFVDNKFVCVDKLFVQARVWYRIDFQEFELLELYRIVGLARVELLGKLDDVEFGHIFAVVSIRIVGDNMGYG